MGIDPRNVVPYTNLLANVICTCDHDARGLVETLLVGGLAAEDLLMVIDFSTSDETPMPMNIDSNAETQAQASVDSAETSIILHQQGLPGVRMQTKAKATCKVLQSAATWAFLVRHGDTLVSLKGSSQTWLQFLDRTTGECLLEAERRRSPLTLNSERFIDKLRLTTLDKASSNERCERAWLRQLDSSWQRIGLGCEVHQIATCHSKVFDLTSSEITGQIHFAISLNSGTGVTRFSKHLLAVVKQRLRIIRGQGPSEEAQRYRRNLLRLCLAQGGRLLQRRLSALTLPNGDWRVADEIQVYVPPGLEYDAQQVASTVAWSLQQLVVPGQFTIFPRSRWTKDDVAFDEFCLLEGIHRLASIVYPLWAADQSDVPIARFSGGDIAGHGNQPGAAETDRGCHDENRGNLLRGATGHGHDQEAAGAGATDPDMARLMNEMHRREALIWLAGRPLGRALLLRQVMIPFKKLQKAYFNMGSDKWDNMQDGVVAESLRSGRNEDRTFAVVECAMQRLEKKFNEDAMMLMNEPVLWADLLPVESQNLSMQGLAFRMISSADALIQESLGLQHRTCPFILLAILADPSRAAEIVNMDPCLFDPWSRSFVARHRGDDGGLLGRIALAKLRLIASVAKIDIKGLESKHASIRRRILSRVQTHASGFEEVSAHWVCSQSRRHGKSEAMKQCDDNKDRINASKVEPARKRRRCGGAWRSFVREKTLGQGGNVLAQNATDMSREYAALSVEEKARHEQIGKAATLAGRRGQTGSCFGSNTRQLRRQVQIRKNAAHAAKPLSLEDTELATASSSNHVDRAIATALKDPTAVNLKQMLTLARNTLRKERQVQRDRVHMYEDALHEWRRGFEPKAWAAIANMSRRAQEFGFVAECMPTPAAGITMKLLTANSIVASIAKRVVAEARNNGLSRALDHDWREKHKPIMHKECPVIDEDAKGIISKPPCWRLGLCICSEDGKLREKFRAAFYKVMKARFPMNSPNRPLVRSKHIIVMLRAVKAVDDNPWAVAAADMMQAQHEPSDHTLFWHIAAHSFSPFRSTFRPLILETQTDAGDGDPEFHLQAWM